MACSLMKKGLLGAALGAGALYLAFGTSAPSYVRTAFHKVRDGAKSNVPVQFEIDRARGEIAALEPAIKDQIENLARADVDVQYLSREIATMKANHETEAKYRLDNYKRIKEQLKDKEETLKSRQKAVVAARAQLQQMAATKQALTTKLAGIEARLKMIETTKDSNEFNFDDSALARAKASVTDLEKRLDVMARTAEMEGKFSDGGIPIIIEPSRDVLKELDTEFGPPAVKTSGGDKNL
jgi:hypothetical protein